jgi:ERCC4-type nuclease
MIFLTKIFPDYYQLCADLGFKNKYKLIDKLPNNDTPYFVQIDTREQRLLAFEGATVEKLNFGDYKLHDSKEYAVYFERKSLNDFVGTMSSGYERFTREIGRAEKFNSHLIIIVENPIVEALNFNRLEKKSFTTRTTPQYIFHNVREIIQKNPHVQFLFVHGRNTAMKVMKRIYQMGDIYKECDLQWLYDTNKFNT